MVYWDSRRGKWLRESANRNIEFIEMWGNAKTEMVMKDLDVEGVYASEVRRLSERDQQGEEQLIR